MSLTIINIVNTIYPIRIHLHACIFGTWSDGLFSLAFGIQFNSSIQLQNHAYRLHAVLFRSIIIKYTKIMFIRLGKKCILIWD